MDMVVNAVIGSGHDKTTIKITSPVCCEPLGGVYIVPKHATTAQSLFIADVTADEIFVINISVSVT